VPAGEQRRAALGRLQATGVAVRVARALGLRARSERRPWLPPRTTAEVAGRRRADLPFEQRSRYDHLRGASGAALTGVLERTLAAGAPLEAIESLGRLWPELTDTARGQVAAPLRPEPGRGQVLLGDAHARQRGPTACGSAVLALLAAAGDPLLALWFVTGRVAAGHLPAPLVALGPTQRVEVDAAARFAAVQASIMNRSNRAALGPLPWPAKLGTPPWGAARVACHPGAVFRAVMIDDTDPARFGALLDRADRALAAGVPVPLFVGGDLATGLSTAVPRHVVLLVPAVAGPGGYAVYEPATGAIHDLTRAELVTSTGPRTALGGWTHACWAVLPQA
jgi:hypothetical protein